MQSITVVRDGAADIRFEGELAAEAATSQNNAHPDYSGSPGRWTELELYRTKNGKFVAVRKSMTCWQGERDSHEAVVCDDAAAVVEFLGHDRLAKELYEAAGIDAAQAVE